VEADADGHHKIEAEEHGVAEEVLIASARLGWDTMVLKEHDPDAVPPSLKAEALVLAAGARLLQGKLEALDGVRADIQSTLRLINDLDLLT